VKKRVGIFLILGFLAGAVAWEYSIRTAWLPAALLQPPPSTPTLADLRGRIFARLATTEARDARPIPLRNMGQWLPLVTVGLEDHRFWQHDGVDIIATAGALWRNIRKGRVVSGASTITQQLVKVATGRPPRTLWTKTREAFAAMRLERMWSKERILEEYLNRIDYGNRRLGVEAAARAYFGKACQDLSLNEAIFLAGLPQSPRRFNPWQNLGNAEKNYRRNVSRLAESQLLPLGAEDLVASPPHVTRNDPERGARAFAELALSRARPAAVIATTLDWDLQLVAESLLSEHMRTAGPMGVGDAAIVVVDNASGEVRAMACAGQAEHAAFNSAIVPRSSGSTLKPFAYLQGIEERRFTAATLMPDTEEAIPATYADYDPQNYNHRAHGPVRVREALGNSLNVPAVVALSQVGARRAFEALRRWGFEIPGNFESFGAGYILGNADIRLLDLAGAYAGIARGGQAWPARVLSSEPIEVERLASPESTAIFTDILCDNEARRLSFGTFSPLNLGMRIAVKTGTSSGFRDRWCVGFSQTHTVAVWAGNLNGRALGEVLAVRAAAPLWAGMMRHLLATGSMPLPEPSGDLVTLDVAAESGLLPRAGERTIKEYFLPGTEPRENAATMYQEGRLVLPLEYASWVQSSQNRLGATAQSGDLTIFFPPDGATFLLTKKLSPHQQVITFQSSSACRWFVNGRLIEGTTMPLRTGVYKVDARAGNVSATSTFRVEEE